MFHATEFFAVLLLIAIAEGALEVSPHVTRRILVSLAAWVFAFAAGVAILSVRRVATDAVGIGLALLAGYIVWLAGTSIVGYFRGPGFFEPPKAGELGDLAQQISGLPARDCRKIARRLLRKGDGAVALLGLLSLNGSGEKGAEEFERAWSEASENARAQAEKSAQSFGAGKSNLLFVAQALCLYDKESVERVLARLAAKGRQGRAARVAATEQLAQMGKERKEARRLGLAAPLKNVQASQAASGLELKPVEILWPPLGLARCGYTGRAAALSVVEGALFGYGVITLMAGRDPGWLFIFPGVYFTSAALIHVQALFAVGDFAWQQVHSATGAETGAEERHEKA
jgi:hypothetical protein